LIGILMAATAATPLAAQDGSWHGRGRDGGEQRSQRVEQRAEAHQQRQEAQTQRVERQQVQQTQRVERQQNVQAEAQVRNNGWAGRREFRQEAPAQVQVQQQAQVRTERFQRNGGNWGGEGRRQDFNAVRNEAIAERNVQDRGRYEQQRNRTDWQQNRRGDNRWDGNRRDGNRNWSGQRFDRNSWNRSWRNDNRYDWQRYRYQNRRIFSPGRYYAPYGGYGYNRLNIGIILGEAFFGRDYWIDPYYYHLPPAPPGTEWVRYYNDVVLVDIYSGEVVDVIYDFFW